MIEEFDPVADQIRSEDSFAFTDKILAHLLQLSFAGADGYGSNSSALPQVVMVDLRNGKAKTRTEPILGLSQH